MGVYAEVRDFVLTHRPCAGPRQANAGPPTVSGYRLIVVCGCGAEFKGHAGRRGRGSVAVGAAGVRELMSLLPVGLLMRGFVVLCIPPSYERLQAASHKQLVGQQLDPGFVRTPP